jgi:hypothetical protein
MNKSQFKKLDDKALRKGLEANSRNSLANKTRDLSRNEPAVGLGKADSLPKDIRNSTLNELKKPAKNSKSNKMAQKTTKDVAAAPGNKPKANNRAAGKPGGQKDLRPSSPSPIGDIARGRDAREFSNRGAHSMGGGEFNRGSGNIRRRGRR